MTMIDFPSRPHLRIATWNLNRPKLGSTEKNKMRSEVIQKWDADIWILTETSDAIQLPGFSFAASDKGCSSYAAGESSATIWSRFPIRRVLQTFDATSSVCAEIHSDIGQLLVYGTIITYANDRGDGTKKRWEEHRRAIQAQALDWVKLRRNFPQHQLIVAGDFNQSRDGSGWYEDTTSVKLLTEALKEASLACVTEEDFRQKGLLKSRATIDHICLSESLQVVPESLRAWEGYTEGGNKLSDHNGVCIDIANSAPKS
ncbi:endonuclease/exonuclease/phosphatase family protein [Noviherbaspirillum galbum]|uniref:Endonuclease/exonuclease/phosphatase family protein n=1 Tax=Noviherbaspirillum galbum TaxID=2709383 RepID=A0A6B3SVC9_9BURK|nr:endonuclease/exonuclease/phosphatase family protein [Noviherbaspirillum galbum]NEX63345.1 endonuclease/exonuclease/phosphatase family protein [Noviherbaspirillum galbum]